MSPTPAAWTTAAAATLRQEQKMTRPSPLQVLDADMPKWAAGGHPVKLPLTMDQQERVRAHVWNEILRSGARFPCGDCGQMVLPAELHTFEDCRKHKAEAAR